MIDPGAIIAAEQRRLGMLDWRITWAWCPTGKLPIPGAIAVCKPTPTRSLAHLLIARPWPDDEDMAETIRHELVHALLSPLTELLEGSDAAVMIEETIVEKLGIALGGPTGATFAPIVARAVDRYAPRLRARISALALRRRERGRKSMDPELKKKALDALLADDAEACKEILKALVTDAAPEGDGDAPPPAREEGPPDDEPPPPARSQGREEEQPMARGRKAVDHHAERARKAADGTVATMVRARLRELRADGIELDVQFESELAAMRDPDAFERRVSDFTRGRAASGSGQQRARSGVEHAGSRPQVEGGEPPPMTAEQLRAEGFGEAFVRDYIEEHKASPSAAAATLAGGRARLGKNANPWGKPAGKA